MPSLKDNNVLIIGRGSGLPAGQASGSPVGLKAQM
jgi:hypothetical protein